MARKAGCRLAAPLSGTPIGRALRAIGVMIDITERRRFEQQLFTEKELAQVTLRSIGDAVITTDHARPDPGAQYRGRAINRLVRGSGQGTSAFGGLSARQ